MAYVLENTIWPANVQIPRATQALIQSFFSLADDSDVNAGDRLATNVFSSDGVMKGSGRVISGKDEISVSRKQAWTQIATRRHTLSRVYVHDHEGLDLMVLGNVTMTLRNGKEVSGGFAAQMVLDAKSENADDPRLKLYEVWADSSPLQTALKDE